MRVSSWTFTVHPGCQTLGRKGVHLQRAKLLFRTTKHCCSQNRKCSSQVFLSISLSLSLSLSLFVYVFIYIIYIYIYMYVCLFVCLFVCAYRCELQTSISSGIESRSVRSGYRSHHLAQQRKTNPAVHTKMCLDRIKASS